VRVVDGPQRVGSEQRWRVTLPGGEQAVLGQLLPELSNDESVRRRYVRDVERLDGIHVPGLAETVAFGPTQTPRDANADPPWRLRRDPRGETLAAWLARRAPAPIDEIADVVAKLAAVVHRIHEHGAVLRDLHPRWVVLAEDGEVWLTDVGLARVDILSTRTAASLILEGSPYASPEQLRRTTLDQRSDLFGLGVILYQSLTGTLPFGDGPALLRETDRLVAPIRLRPEVPAPLSDLVVRCLSDDPEGRPESADQVVRVLRGEVPGESRSLVRVSCQNCGASLRPGQRLCLNCGRQAVQYRHGQAGAADLQELLLSRAKEDEDFFRRLRGFLKSVSDQAIPNLDFVIGDRRMYSKQELERRIVLPVALFTDLDPDTAERMRARMAEEGFAVTLRDKVRKSVPKRHRRKLGLGAGAVIAAVIGASVLGAAPVAVAVGAVGTIGLLVAYLAMKNRKPAAARPGMMRLRSQPAALPASDPLVARMAGLLDTSTPTDVREQVGELALLIQRLVDHRIAARGDKAEFDLVTEPVEPLIGLVERQVTALSEIDEELVTLDEGAIVRALSASDARGDPASARADLLDGLDRLRGLEEARARAFHRLLEASSLLRRAAEMGLAIHDEEAEHERQIALARAVLDVAELSPATDT
jgi:energy-converting hydrogenase Eha subunit C